MKVARQPPLLALALAIGIACSACGAVQSVADAPGKMTKALLPGQQAPDKKPISELHPDLLHLADYATRRLRASTVEFADAVGTPEGRIQAVQWRLDFTRGVLERATGPVPLVGTLDLLVGARAGALILEERMESKALGEAARPLLAAYTATEKHIWETLQDYFTAGQLAGLRQTIDTWEESQRGRSDELAAEAPTFGQIVQSLSTEESKSGGFLGLIQLDPLAGLEPMAREVALTRQFAERLLFWSERLPMLIDDQVELATLQARQLPEVVQVLADVERVSGAADTLAQTAVALPDKLSAEREAALRQAADEIAALRDSTLQQVSAEITAQREGLVHDLETAQEPLESLLGESRSAFTAAQGMTTELNALVVAVGVFLDRFETPAGEEPPAEPSEPSEPGRPFDITEYGDTATRLGQAAAELRELVATLDASLPQVEQMVDAAASRGDETIDHAFKRGLQLGLILIAAVAAAVLLVRLAARRLPGKAA